MKCPHCNQEHPDDWKACPITGHPLTPSAPTAPNTQVCSNPNCRMSGIPANANFCPNCRHPLKPQMKSPSMNGQKFSPDSCEIKIFIEFPGITLGETKLDDAEKMPRYKKVWNGYRTLEDKYGRSFIEEGRTINKVLILKDQPLPNEWAKLGLNWNLSPSELYEILAHAGLLVDISNVFFLRYGKKRFHLHGRLNNCSIDFSYEQEDRRTPLYIESISVLVEDDFDGDFTYCADKKFNIQ